MGSQPVVDQIVLSHPTHGKRHSSFYESDHRNDNLPFVSICNHPIWSTISQGYSLWNVVLSPEALHTIERVYKVLKSTNLSELKMSKKFSRKRNKE